MLEISKDAPAATIKIDYDLLTETVLPKIRKALSDLISEGCINITLDFDEVELLDSPGIGLLISAKELLQKQNGTLTIINVSPNIFEMLKIMRLDKRLNLKKANR